MCHTTCLQSLASLCRLWAPLMLFLGEGLRMPCNLQSLILGRVYTLPVYAMSISPHTSRCGHKDPEAPSWTFVLCGPGRGPAIGILVKSSQTTDGRDGCGSVYPPFTSALLLYSVSRLKLSSLPSTSAQPGWLTQVVC